MDGKVSGSRRQQPKHEHQGRGRQGAGALPRRMLTAGVIDALKARGLSGKRRHRHEHGRRSVHLWGLSSRSTTTPTSTANCSTKSRVTSRRTFANDIRTAAADGSGRNTRTRFSTTCPKFWRRPSCSSSKAKRTLKPYATGDSSRPPTPAAQRRPGCRSIRKHYGAAKSFLIPDADEPGRRRVLAIARALIGKAAKIIVLELEGAKDISEWFERGHSETELIAQLEGEGVSR